MIILENKKLAFIHIPKTSGSSLTKIFYPLMSNNKNLLLDGNGWQGTFHIGYQHDTIDESLDNIKNFKELNFITIVRNPYDWIASIWYNLYKKKYPIFKDYLNSDKIKIYYNKNNQSDFIKNNKNIKVKYYKFEENPIKKICNNYSIDYDNSIHLLNHKRDKIKLYNYDLNMIKIVNKLLYDDFINFNYEILNNVHDVNLILK